MTLKRLPQFVLLLLAAPVLAQETVITPTIDEIREDAGVLAGAALVSTGQPDEDVLHAAKAAGFVAVIDMRGAGEDRGIDEESAAIEAGLTYVNLPVMGADDVTFDNARTLDELLASIDGPVLMHCASGNRVGALMALRASLHGASDEDAMAAGKAAGLTRLEPVVGKRLAEDPH